MEDVVRAIIDLGMALVVSAGSLNAAILAWALGINGPQLLWGAGERILWTLMLWRATPPGKHRWITFASILPGLQMALMWRSVWLLRSTAAAGVVLAGLATRASAGPSIGKGAGVFFVIVLLGGVAAPFVWVAKALAIWRMAVASGRPRILGAVALLPFGNLVAMGILAALPTKRTGSRTQL